MRNLVFNARMVMGIQKAVFIFSLIFFVGCAHKITYYPLESSLIPPKDPPAGTLRIERFIDQRPSGEKEDENLVHRHERLYRKNNLKLYVSKEIETGITQVVALHLNQSGLFKEVGLSDHTLETPSTQKAGIKQIPESEADFIMRGRVLNFTSYVQANPTREFTLGFISGFTFGIAGLLITLPVESSISKHTETIAALQVEIVDQRTGQTVFLEEVRATKDEKRKGFPTPYNLADDLLGEIVAQLIHKLSVSPLTSKLTFSR